MPSRRQSRSFAAQITASVLNLLHRLWQAARYRIRAGTAHSVHSPFVYGFYEEVLHFPGRSYGADETEACRLDLLRNREILRYQDLGARGGMQTRRVSDLAATSACSPEKGERLLNLVRWFRPRHILELGTCLGIGTAYLSVEALGRVTSVEGIPRLCQLAAETLSRVAPGKAELICGEIETVLEAWLADPENRPDLVYLDANHRLGPTLDYAGRIIPLLPGKACLVLDDIYWSPEMTRAWNQLRRHERVSVSVDTFDLGFLFFGLSMPPQHFTLR